MFAQIFSGHPVGVLVCESAKAIGMQPKNCPCLPLPHNGVFISLKSPKVGQKVESVHFKATEKSQSEAVLNAKHLKLSAGHRESR